MWSHCIALYCVPASSALAGAPPWGRHAPSHQQTTKRLRRASALEQGWALLGQAWLPSLAHLCFTSGCLSMLPALQTLCQAPGPLLQWDLWWQQEIFPLPSSLVPLRILPAEAPGAGQQQDCWAAWAPPWPCVIPQDPVAGPSHTPQVRAMSLDQHSSVACRGFGWRRAEYQALVQPGAGEMHVVHADKKQVLWSGGTIAQGLLRNDSTARVLELPGSTEQWDRHGTFGEQCLAQPVASL